MPANSLDELVSLCKRRGFIFQSSEIYGGLKGVYDYGPLGVELKNNLKLAWWSAMVYERDDIEGLDSAILTHQQVMHYSGHEDTFSDPLIDCKKCRSRWRDEDLIDSRCPSCGSNDLTEPRDFNLMFKTNVGPVDDNASFAYLRPETAQQIFINYKNILDSRSMRVPFGIAQIGKAFRNEITPRNFIFRMREFEQMELEFFVAEGEDDEWHRRWVELRLDWWHDQGIVPNSLEPYHVPQEELAHYSKATVDIMYKFPHGLEELEGIANRTDFDLASHSKKGKYTREKDTKNEHSTVHFASLPSGLPADAGKLPYVIEPSAGVDRGVLAILNEAYTEETLENGSDRIVLKLKPHLAPIKTAIVPLKQNHADIVSLTNELKVQLAKLKVGRIACEKSGNIGKNYRKHDEAGTPFCITVDFETLEDGTVTIRDRDTTHQFRLHRDKLGEYLNDQL